MLLMIEMIELDWKRLLSNMWLLVMFLYRRSFDGALLICFTQYKITIAL